MFPYFWHPFRNVVTTASQYMILAVSLDRYLAICYNIRVSLQPYLYTGIVLVFSLLVNIPKFFEFEPNRRLTNADQDAHHSSNGTTDAAREYGYHTSDVAEEPTFLIFNAYYEVLVTTFCLCAICYCNYQNFHQIRGSAKFCDM